MVGGTTDHRTRNEKFITIHGWKQRTGRRSIRGGTTQTLANWDWRSYTHSRDGKIEYRWHGNGGTGLALPFKKGWTEPSGRIYYNDNQIGPQDQPYYGTDLEVNQRDILCHSFKLTAGGHLPQHIINFIKNHTDTWYGKEDKMGTRKRTNAQ